MTSVQSVFGQTLQRTDEWIGDLMAEEGRDDPQRAYSTLRAVLHALRDRLTPDEAVDLAAPLPMLVRGFYFEGWRPQGRPQRYRHRQEFLDQVAARLRRPSDGELEAEVGAVFRVLSKHVPGGEIDDVRAQLPEDIRALWPGTGGH